MPEPSHITTAEAVMIAVFSLLVLSVVYTRIVLIPRIKKKWRNWRYC